MRLVDTCRQWGATCWVAFNFECSRFFESGIVIKLLLSLPQVQCLKGPLSIKPCTLLFPFCVLTLVLITSCCHVWRHALSRRSVGIERHLLPSIWINYVSPIHVPIWAFSFKNDLVLTVADMIQVISEEVIVSWPRSLKLKWRCPSGIQAIPSVSAWLFRNLLPCAYVIFLACTERRPIRSVRRVFYLLFFIFTTKLIPTASLGIDFCVLRPCWMDALQLSGSMFLLERRVWTLLLCL